VALLLVMVVAFVGITVRLAFLQVRDADQYQAQGLEQRARTIELPATRGEIVDRSGTPLAITVESADLYVDPTQVVDAYDEALRLAPLLERTPREIRELLLTEGTTFVYLAQQVEPELADRVMALGLPGVNRIASTRREYPAGALAPQVLGFVKLDGEGAAGLEDRYDAALAGVAGMQRVELSQFGEPIPTGDSVVQAPIPGVDVRTTIDRQLQYQAQVALADAIEANGARGGTIIVMDPRTGDIYAMASAPWFDPNETSSYDPDRLWELARNRAVTDVYEPGSTNKVITAAAALDSGAVSPTERFRVPWTMRIEDDVIEDAHGHATEPMTLGDIISASSNVGAAMVAGRVGDQRMQGYLRRFGYGHPSEVGFPAEAAGILPPADWDELTLSTVAFGQGVAVTPLQMASVYATIANGGVWVRPRLVDGTVGADGTFRPAPAPERRRVVSATTADMVTRMLANVVENGTGLEARIPGYQVAGKTGTARKLDDLGNYMPDRTIASFIGFLPAGDPELVVAAIIDEPTTVYGGIAAAPLFQHVARFAIQRLGIAPADTVSLPPHLLTAT
jgi:cell division protein FtsI (penicillin-binding protein 3)